MKFVQSTLLLIGGSSIALAAEASYDCVPTMSCWPTPQEWQSFNVTIGGRLVRTTPWAAPCFLGSPQYNAAACSAVSSNYTTGLQRAGVYGAMEILQYESCGDTGCMLQSIAPGLPPLGQKCELGRLSAYHVDARAATHIAATINFAKQHNIRLSVKNTGHDYLGRSSAPNTLALWTHNLQTKLYHATFTPKNCPAAGRKIHVGEIGAGVVAQDAYDFFETYEMSVCGGNAGSVGLAGGFGQAGGHGIFTPTYGLMVDQAIEFEVVTADGEIRVINECNDPDLFWAMRGGGGGTYAILVAYRFQLYPAQPIHMHHFKAKFTFLGSLLSRTSITRSLVAAHVQNQVAWSDNSVAGRFYYGSNFVEFHTVLPYLDDGTKLKALTKAWIDKIRAIRGLTIELDQYATYQKYSDYNTVAQEAAARLTPNGYAAHVSSRLVPRSLFVNSSEALVNATLEGIEINDAITSAIKGSPALEVLMTTPVRTPDAQGSTSAHPAWRSALWHAVYLGGWVKGTSQSSQQSTVRRIYNATEPLRDLTPGGGSYLNEDSILIDDWPSTFFGPNYERLLAIKARYDPTHLLDCYKCVGWRGASDRAYSCYGPNPTGSTISV